MEIGSADFTSLPVPRYDTAVRPIGVSFNRVFEQLSRLSGSLEGALRLPAAPTVKQQLAAIRMTFDYLVVGQVVPVENAPVTARRFFPVVFLDFLVS